MATTDPIRNQSDLVALAEYFLKRGQYRNQTMIVLGVCTALRVSDLLKLRWRDVYDFDHARWKAELRLVEQKTGKRKTIALNHRALEALQQQFPHQRGEYIFSNGRTPEKPITRSQAWRIIHDAAQALGIPGVISPHSLRKTLGYRARLSGTASPDLLVRLYAHSSYAITQRYLGITQDEVNNVYLNTKLF